MRSKEGAGNADRVHTVLDGSTERHHSSSRSASYSLTILHYPSQSGRALTRVSLPLLCRLPSPVPVHIGTGSVISTQSRRELSKFIGSSVLPATNRVYEGHWTQWTAFLKQEVNEEDPFLCTLDDSEKASLVSLMMLRKHEVGQRGKAATAFIAGIVVLALLPSLTALRPHGLVDSAFSPLAFGLGFDPWLCRFTPQAYGCVSPRIP